MTLSFEAEEFLRSVLHTTEIIVECDVPLLVRYNLAIPGRGDYRYRGHADEFVESPGYLGLKVSNGQIFRRGSYEKKRKEGSRRMGKG